MTAEALSIRDLDWRVERPPACRARWARIRPAVEGSFRRGEMVACVGPDGQEVARVVRPSDVADLAVLFDGF